MTERIQPHAAAPEAIDAMLALSSYVNDCGLEHSLAELVKIRASQVNGCANCLHMHTADARTAGETEARLLTDQFVFSGTFGTRPRLPLPPFGPSLGGGFFAAA